MNSRDKGCRGEREAATEVARILKCEACRGQQHSGGSESPDVKHSLPGLHIEVKRTERLKLYDALEQAIDDKAENDVPIVLHRRNHKPWVAIIRLDDLPWLAMILYLHLSEKA